MTDPAGTPTPQQVRRALARVDRGAAIDVDEAAVVAAIDAKSIYDIPKVLHTEGLDAYVVRKLDLPFRDVDWTTWDDLMDRVHNPDHEVTVALANPAPERSRVAGRARRVAGAGECLVEHGADRSVVVGDEDIAFGHEV